MKRLIEKEFLKKILIIFLICQPILDFYLLYDQDIVSLFGFSPTTIIRTAIISILFLLIFIFYTNKKEYIFIGIYGVFILFYLVLHHWNANNFSALVPDTFRYSLVSEMFYIYRLSLPLMLLFIIYKLKPTFKEIKIVVLSLVGIISSVIIISNILKISLTSYGGDNIIKDNIFSWFLGTTFSAEQLLSKGWFYSANQISGLLVLLLPLTIYFAIVKPQNYKMILLFMHVLAMIIVGTRVAAYGSVLILGLGILIYLFFCLIKRDIRFDKIVFSQFLIIIFLSTFVLFNSPTVSRIDSKYYLDIEKQLQEKEKEKELEGELPDDLEGYLDKKLSFLTINPYYYKNLYDYKKHGEFWKMVSELPFEKRTGNRNLQMLITTDIYERNDNEYDILFGLTFSRMTSGGVYLEKDIFVHYYTIGIVGIALFILPYIIIGFYKGISMIFSYREKFTIFNTMFLFSLAVVIGSSIFSGHILDELIVTIFIGLASGIIIAYNNENEIEVDSDAKS